MTGRLVEKGQRVELVNPNTGRTEKGEVEGVRADGLSVLVHFDDDTYTWIAAKHLRPERVA